MGTKYTTNVVANYNSSPPSDDGSQTASNQGFWSTIKTKIGDPLNSAIAAINSSLLTSLDQSARTVTTSGTISASDHDRTIEIGSSVSTTIILTLSDASSLASGFVTTIVNRSLIQHTIARTTAGDVIGTVATNVIIPSLGQIKLGVNQAANGFNVHAQSYALQVGVLTRDMSLATSDVAVTGLKGRPIGVLFVAVANGQAGLSFGFDTLVDVARCGYDDSATLATTYNSTSSSILVQPVTSGAYLSGVLKSTETDGFTLTLTKVGSPVGTATIQWFALVRTA